MEKRTIEGKTMHLFKWERPNQLLAQSGESQDNLPTIEDFVHTLKEVQHQTLHHPLVNKLPEKAYMVFYYQDRTQMFHHPQTFREGFFEAEPVDIKEVLTGLKFEKHSDPFASKHKYVWMLKWALGMILLVLIAFHISNVHLVK